MADRPRILVVDDDPKILEIVAFLLTGSDHEVRVAANGQEAVQAAPDFRPDVILMDVTMPQMDGFTACRKIKKEPGLEKTPVIFLTARKGPKNWSEAQDSGAVAYLEKPFRKDALVALVREVLERSRGGEAEEKGSDGG